VGDTSDASGARLESVLGRFASYLRAVGRQHGLDEVEQAEVVQDVRIRLWRAMARPDGPAHGENRDDVPASYIVKAMRSAVFDLLRSRRSARQERQVEIATADAGSGLPDPAADPMGRLEQAETARLVGACLAAMAPARRVVVQLHLAGHPRAEIERLLGWSEAKTRNLLYRGLADLRVALRQAGVSFEGKT
jgi:RNA polymerase sigma-70 factor (ECF subfamily)